MTTIISPWVFYLMPVCENIGLVSLALAVISGLALVGVFAAYYIDYDYHNKDEISRFKFWIKLLSVIVIITLLLVCLVPTEETITKMIIAQNVTYERVDVVSDTVANVYNDIMNLFQESGATSG